MPHSPDQMFDHCDTLMLDMDGTLLDLAFDNHLWLEIVPTEYARRHSMDEARAKSQLLATMKRLEGTLDWYCLDFWSDHLDLDIEGIHRQQNHRIGYLPGAREFLERARATGVRMLMVTNSHRTTLDIKNEVTDVLRFFDAVYTSHDLGAAKEDQPFWQSLQAKEGFDKTRTMFIDDNLAVLASAKRFGVQHLVAVAQPDTRVPARQVRNYHSIEGVANLLTYQA